MKIIFAAYIALMINFSLPAQDYSAQYLDSMYYSYLKLKGASEADMITGIDTLHNKCGFGAAAFIRENFNLFSEAQKKILLKYFARPVTHTSFVTPSGFFRVHYDTSGEHTPGYNLTELTAAIDSAYRFEVEYLGYPPPIDNGTGGDNRYDIYLQNMGGGLYGYTEFEDNIQGSKRTTYMVIDNDFTGYYSSGIEGAMVTVAHEMHHGIQVGNYLYRDADVYFYELSSTAMEEFVFDSVNDYYAYMRTFFRNPEKSFGQHDGYNLAVWNIFLKEKFGYDILKAQWNMMPLKRALQAIANSIEEAGENFRIVYNQFAVWCYFTNYRYREGEYFEEGLNYPVLDLVSMINFIPPRKDVSMEASPVSINFLGFRNTITPEDIDTLDVLITNSDYMSGINSINSKYNFQYSLLSDSVEGAVNLADKYYQLFVVDRPSFWTNSEVLNGQLIREGTIFIDKVDFAFPSPFRYDKHSYMYIPVKPDASNEAFLNIYSSGMELMYQAELNVKNYYGQKLLIWDGLNNKKEKLASGIYIFMTKSGDNTTKGKLVIFNE